MKKSRAIEEKIAFNLKLVGTAKDVIFEDYGLLPFSSTMYASGTLSVNAFIMYEDLN
ncbi:hypothetical protein [Klebsiella quasipneumoniae]|uniref:hypothetical protein n=1 Tax=Klebsiella quasipneumoniae TaxID=1463165 RepID=UPI0013EFA4FB|nr:hypothetical protein [Klebsiella quasipneumoniae]